MFYMRTYVHLREHLELNSHAVYSVFIRVKNVLMKPFRVNRSRLSVTNTLFLLCSVVAKMILKKWANVPDYCMCVFSNFFLCGCYIVASFCQIYCKSWCATLIHCQYSTYTLCIKCFGITLTSHGSTERTLTTEIISVHFCTARRFPKCSKCLFFFWR